MSSELSCETSDEASENELLDRSLSVWRGWSAIEREDFTPVPLDLHTACSIGQYDWVRSIIARNEGAATVDKKNKGGWTALMYACYIGHDNIVNLLVKAGCQMNKMKNPRGHTPLMLAASCGNENVARTLVRNGAELEVMDKSGWTALFHSTYAGHQNFVAYLLEAGANINAVEPTTGLSPFMLAAAEGHEIIVQLFLQHGVNVHAKAYNGDMARSLSLIKGYMKIVSLIDNHTMPASRLRSEPGLDFYLSSSDDDQPRQLLRGIGVTGQKKSKGPSIRDGPDAIARMIDRTRPDDMPLGADMPTPKGYVSFSNTAIEKEGTTQLSHRDVTSPINHEDYKDTSGDAEDFGDDSNAFSKTGAITIKSSSSSSGGLVAALGLSREGSLDSDDSRGYDLSHQNMEGESSEHLDSNTDSADLTNDKDLGKDGVVISSDGTTEVCSTSRSVGENVPLSKQAQPNCHEVMKATTALKNLSSSSSSSSDSLKEKPKAVVLPLRDYFPLDVSFPPVDGEVGETNQDHCRYHHHHHQGVLRPTSGVEHDFHPPSDQREEQSLLPSSPLFIQQQQQQQQRLHQPPRDIMSQSEIVQAYFNSMRSGKGGGGGNGGNGNGSLTLPQQKSNIRKNEEDNSNNNNNNNNIDCSRNVASTNIIHGIEGSVQQQLLFQTERGLMNLTQSGGNHCTGQGASNQNNAVTSTHVQQGLIHLSVGNQQRESNEEGGLFMPIGDSDSELNPRARSAQFTSPVQQTRALSHEGQQQQQQQQRNFPSSNQYPINPPFSSFPQDFGNQNVLRILDSDQINQPLQHNLITSVGQAAGGAIMNPQSASMTQNEGATKFNHTIPHYHQTSSHLQLQTPPFTSPHIHYQQSSNVYQNTTHNFIHHHPPQPPISSEYYSDFHLPQSQQQQAPLLPHTPSQPPPPLHHHYHHHHHHMQHHHQQQNPYSIFPRQDSDTNSNNNDSIYSNIPLSQQPPLIPTLMQNFRPQQPLRHPSPQQQQNNHPSMSPYSKGHFNYRNFPQDSSSYPPSFSPSAFDTTSYYKTIPSEIYYSDMSTFSALHFGNVADNKGLDHLGEIIFPSDSNPPSGQATSMGNKCNTDDNRNKDSSSSNSYKVEKSPEALATTTEVGDGDHLHRHNIREQFPFLDNFSMHEIDQDKYKTTGVSNSSSTSLSSPAISEMGKVMKEGKRGERGGGGRATTTNTPNSAIAATSNTSIVAATSNTSIVAATSNTSIVRNSNTLPVQSKYALTKTAAAAAEPSKTVNVEGFSSAFTSLVETKSSSSIISSSSSSATAQSFSVASSSHIPTSATKTNIITHSTLASSKPSNYTVIPGKTAVAGSSSILPSAAAKGISHNIHPESKTIPIPAVKTKYSHSTTADDVMTGQSDISSTSNTVNLPNSNNHNNNRVTIPGHTPFQPTSSTHNSANATPNSVMIPGHTTSQPVSQSIRLLDHEAHDGAWCKDLREMLAQLGLSKYLEKFEEQDVDLQVFLSLTDNDLKEVGIKLFGPRKKMANAIARWHSQAPLPNHCLEQAYADRLEGEMQELAIQLNQAYANEERLKAQVLQEQQLRSVTESCLMEVRGHWEKTRQMVEEAQGIMKTMGESLARLRGNQKELRKTLEISPDGPGASSTKPECEQLQLQQQQQRKTGEEKEGVTSPSSINSSSFSPDGSLALELVRKSERYLKEMHKGLSSLAHNADKVLKSTQDLSNLDKKLEEI